MGSIDWVFDRYVVMRCALPASPKLADSLVTPRQVKKRGKTMRVQQSEAQLRLYMYAKTMPGSTIQLGLVRISVREGWLSSPKPGDALCRSA